MLQLASRRMAARSATSSQLWHSVSLLVLALLLQASIAQELVNITILDGAVEEGAVCLDGSPPAYYFRRGSTRSWMIFVQGGGWCYGNSEERSCLTRINSELGSSTLLSRQRSLNFGAFNISREGNPDFWNWNHVFLPYCDGASFVGDVSEPVKVPGTNTTLYYRGLRIWDYTMRSLLDLGMKNADKVLLSGCSAGAVATMLHCNDFRDLLPSETTVKCFMDGGYFLDEKALTGNYSFRTIVQEIVNEHHIDFGVKRGYVPSNASFQQLFPLYLVPSVKPPVFILNAAYDTWQIRNTLLYPISQWKPCVDDPTSCQPDQLKILQGYRYKFLRALRPAIREKDWGLFINSCFAHCEGDQSTVQVSNKTILGALAEWFYDRSPSKYIDCLPWPSNPTCVTVIEDTWL